MKTRNLLTALFLIFSITIQAQIMDLESTTEGVTLPRMTTVQRVAISSPSISEMVYDTDTKTFWYYDGTNWIEVISKLTKNDSGNSSPGIPIPDNDPTGITDVIAITDQGVIDAETDIKVCIDISHTWASDIDISLLAPDGVTSIDLCSDNGGQGDNFLSTCFSDKAVTPIENISESLAPFTNTYRPEETFSNFIGQNINGNWTLKVIDDTSTDTGTLNSWSIEFNKGICLPETDGAVDQVMVSDGAGNLNWKDKCMIFGDGSAGNFSTSGNVDWRNNGPANNNYMFDSLTINTGDTLFLSSGTRVRCLGALINNGVIFVMEGIPRQRWGGEADGGFPARAGLTLSQRFSLNESQLVQFREFGPFGGANGTSGSSSGIGVNGGSGGGTLVILSKKGIINTGFILANGGDGVTVAAKPGTGGGGGGMILLATNGVFSNPGIISAIGGDGSNAGVGGDDLGGGGGGGGLVHLMGPAIESNGSIQFTGGNGGLNDGSGSGGDGGNGGAGAADGGLGGESGGSASNGGLGLFLKSTVKNVCPVFN